jgi:prepilin-type N-terminal cleavage/methylation domain-containing protein
MRSNKAFTMIEMMVVMVVMAVMASLAIPQYSLFLQRGRENNMVAQLISLQSVNKIYKSRKNEYLNTSGVAKDSAYLETYLGVEINPDAGVTHSYSSNGVTFTLQTCYGDFCLRVDEGSVDSSNPCCSDPTCPTRPNC